MTDASSYLTRNPFSDAGADVRRVIFCHQDGSGTDFAYQQELLRRGVNLAYDLFGFELAFAASERMRGTGLNRLTRQLSA